MRVLITGAGSYVGIHIAQWLHSKSDYQVETLDMMNDAWKDWNFKGYDVIFHVAGIAHRKATPKNKELYFRVNRDLTFDVAQKAKENKIKQFIYMSSMSVFHGEDIPFEQIITPETPLYPTGYYGESKLQAENLLLSLEDNTFKVCILRPPMIYGVGAKGNFPRLIKLASITPIFPDFHNRRSMLYIDNLAEFVLQAIKYQLNGIFYPQNRELSDTVDIVRYFADVQKHPIRFWHSLNPLVRILCHILPPVNKMFGSYYYEPTMSKMDFDYQLVSFEESLKRIQS